MCKAMCGVAAGSVGGAINLYWAAQGTDISDISAKFGAQQTVTASLGLIFAAVLAKSISNVPTRTVWLLYTGLTMLHIYANIRCMRIIAFDSFNAGRLRIIFHQFWKQYKERDSHSPADDGILLSTPRETASREPLFFLPQWMYGLGHAPPIVFGVPFNDVAVQNNSGTGIWAQETDMLTILKRPYWLAVSDTKCGFWGKKRMIKVALNADATPRQRIEAYFAALVVSEKLKTQAVTGEIDDDQQPQWAAFCQTCEGAGWELDHNNIASQGYEVTIDVPK